MDIIRAKMIKSSPVYFIDAYRKDLLLIQGKNDQVVPLSNATMVIDRMEGYDHFEYQLTDGGHDFYDWAFVTDWIKQHNGE